MSKSVGHYGMDSAILGQYLTRSALRVVSAGSGFIVSMPANKKNAKQQHGRVSGRVRKAFALAAIDFHLLPAKLPPSNTVLRRLEQDRYSESGFIPDRSTRAQCNLQLQASGQSSFLQFKGWPLRYYV